ncbi:LCP family protein [Leptolyngbya ohadii]|uniref:LCP family protein n=1 Tax=Leptolyngbya ohadii TaxID=1962290 RepID=UPI001CEDCDA4|nr:LCP family protein [Leptolyngbya ohadii]
MSPNDSAANPVDPSVGKISGKSSGKTSNPMSDHSPAAASQEQAAKFTKTESAVSAAFNPVDDSSVGSESVGLESGGSEPVNSIAPEDIPVAIAKPSTTIYVSTAPARSSSKWRWVGLTAGLAIIAAVSASAGALLAVAISGTPLMQSRLSAEEAKAFNQDEPIATGMNLKLPQLTRPVNVLVLGIKVLSSEVENPPPETQNLRYHAVVNSLDGLSDSMLLVRFDPQSHQLTVLSLPRDTRTLVEGAGTTKLNEANVYGGPALAARSVTELLGGVEIDRYVRINVQGVEKLIDALGGVKVNVPQDMSYKDDSQHLYINLKKGEQLLNGAQAVQFLRFRYDALGDIGRVQRQQMFMRALVEQALKPTTLSKTPQVLSVIQSNLDTNLNVEELIALAGFAAQTNRPNVKMLMLPGSFSSSSEYEASYWLPNQFKIDALMQQYFGLPATSDTVAHTPTTAEIVVQNSTEDDRAIDQLMVKLKTNGYSNLYVDQPWNEPLVTTQIVAQGGDVNAAEAVRQTLGFGEVLVESTGDLNSDVTIRLGTDVFHSPTPIADPSVAPPTVLPPALQDILAPAASPVSPASPVPQPEGLP